MNRDKQQDSKRYKYRWLKKNASVHLLCDEIDFELCALKYKWPDLYVFQDTSCHSDNLFLGGFDFSS